VSTQPSVILIGAAFGLAMAVLLPFFLVALWRLFSPGAPARAWVICGCVWAWCIVWGVLNRLNPQWATDPGWGAREGGTFLLVGVIVGIVIFVALWRVGYLRWVRRRVLGPAGTPDNSPR
jgi:uncharacterized protein YqhQ